MITLLTESLFAFCQCTIPSPHINIFFIKDMWCAVGTKQEIYRGKYYNWTRRQKRVLTVLSRGHWVHLLKLLDRSYWQLFVWPTKHKISKHQNRHCHWLAILCIRHNLLILKQNLFSPFTLISPSPQYFAITDRFLCLAPIILQIDIWPMDGDNQSNNYYNIINFLISNITVIV